VRRSLIKMSAPATHTLVGRGLFPSLFRPVVDRFRLETCVMFSLEWRVIALMGAVGGLLFLIVNRFVPGLRPKRSRETFGA